MFSSHRRIGGQREAGVGSVSISKKTEFADEDTEVAGELSHSYGRIETSRKNDDWRWVFRKARPLNDVDSYFLRLLVAFLRRACRLRWPAVDCADVEFIRGPIGLGGPSSRR